MKKYSTKDFEREYPNDDACLDWLFKARWPKGVKCIKCNKVTKHYRIKDRACYACEFCGNHVYPMAGTIFQDTRFDHLRLWFKAIIIMSATRCGISSRNLSRDLGVTIKTGYRMWKQVRSILSDGHDIKFMGKVEIDETYIGGKHRGKHGRGSENKSVVLGIIERNGRARAIIVPDVKAKTLIPHIEAHVIKCADVYTDDYPTYQCLSRLGFKHQVVAHSKKIYVTGKDIHTNSVEGFWSQLKRSIDGTYHHVTPEHLQEYTDEYSFRYNHRNDEQPMFITMLNQVIKRASVKV
jgi:transposase